MAAAFFSIVSLRGGFVRFEGADKDEGAVGAIACEVAREFSISKQTVSNYLNQKEKILEAAEKVSAGTQKNFRDGSYPKLEEALNLWLSAKVAKKIPVSGDLLKQKAETLALRMGITGCKFSDGWLRNFKKSGKSYVVDVLSAISILSDAWKAVTQETVHNCFRHAGFVNTESGDEDSATDLDPAVETPPTAAADILDDLRASGVDIPGGDSTPGGTL
ncbi:hypothetical protein HPB52_000135 [Rhipicephalus sanguineus]|uniref:HTH CENPB-type domain-containing protein n=1 Tax=Rhipicephalus sanguineus TaxID=34632 RepID=A0A9D4Q6I6_RHISA|nr:hypothetical protein HPB52_000135 [Rhipicephalus sanguineus]